MFEVYFLFRLFHFRSSCRNLIIFLKWTNRSKSLCLLFPLDFFPWKAWFRLRNADKWKVESSVALCPLLVGYGSPIFRLLLSWLSFLIFWRLRVIKSPPQSKATLCTNGAGTLWSGILHISGHILLPRTVSTLCTETDQQLWLVCLVPVHSSQNSTNLFPVWMKVLKETMSLIRA